MTKQWAPSLWGRQLTGSPDWRLRLDGWELSLTMEGRTHRINVEKQSAYRIHLGILWTDITFYPGQKRETKADGLPNVEGLDLAQALKVVLTEKRIHEDVAFLQDAHRTIDQWLEHKAK